MRHGMWLVPLVMGVLLALSGVFGGRTEATGKGFGEEPSLSSVAPEEGSAPGFQKLIVLLACGAAGLVCMGRWRNPDGDDAGFPGDRPPRGRER